MFDNNTCNYIDLMFNIYVIVSLYYSIYQSTQYTFQIIHICLL